MGKGALVLVMAASFAALLVVNNTQNTSLETEDLNNRNHANILSSDLALKGRKLVLSSWIESSGSASTTPFNSIALDGGTLDVTQYTVTDNVLDMTVRGIFDGAVHDVRSRYEWNSFGLNPLQIKSAKVDLELDPNTNLGFDEITVDDQTLQDLHTTLIDELQLASDLSEFGLGASELVSELESELTSSGHSDISASLMNQAQRDALEQENGMYFPDQVEQAISSYIATNPNLETVLTDPSLIPSTFGTGEEVLRIKDDVTLSGSLVGKGILIVEGSFIVPHGVTLDWEGLILVKPPASNLNPQIDFSGMVTINGGLVALHEAIPNSGHLDVTTFRDYAGTWASPVGTEHKLSHFGWNWCLYHQHDFTSLHGNSITYHSNVAAERLHEAEVHFYETLNALNPTDEIIIEVSNHDSHGRGIVALELDGETRLPYPVAAGFDPMIVAASNAYRTRTFKAGDLNYFHIDITRLSSLKKMWDHTTDPYPGCTAWGGLSGPVCIGYDYNRMGALTFKLYLKLPTTERLIYEASMYWHRRPDEEEAFNDMMDQLVSDIQSPDYGLDINFGNNVSIAAGNSALDMLGAFSGVNRGLTHLGTWQTHWDPTDPDNPTH